ncbi:MAG: hypothetical protein HYT79_02700 [Elusimicrobia bacterium]|nr:hypothetical protein [Elusimicrobiota bacterium]
MTFKDAEIQLCSFTAAGDGIDLPETERWYNSPRDGKQAAQAILDKHPHIASVWVRKVRDAHIRTVAVVQREEAR